MRPSRGTIVLLCLGLAATACTGQSDPADTGAASPTGEPATSPPTATSTAGTGSAKPSAPASSTAEASGTTRCAERIIARLTPTQRAGQLVMVGLQAGTDAGAVTSLIRERHVGNVIYLGGWEGTSGVRRASSEIERSSGGASTGGLRPLIAADQEGGQVWQIRGGGERLPPALQQGSAGSGQRTAYGRQIGTLLKSVGVNLNLAPVADTVPPSIGRANEPIGKWGRQYGNDPKTVSAAVPDVIRGLHDGGVAATIKHFPGLGRVTGNTDFTTTGIEDDQATREDPHLEPFRAGIRGGADLVMMSSARYPKLDADNPALFSRTIVQDVLRRQLSFDGVVITDDVAAAAVRDVPAGDRATRFVAAGGDIVLTGQAADVPTMLDALVTKAEREPAFEKQVEVSVRRVVALKLSRGLASCD